MENKNKLKIVYKSSPSERMNREKVIVAQNKVIDYIIKKLIYETGS